MSGEILSKFLPSEVVSETNLSESSVRLSRLESECIYSFNSLAFRLNFVVKTINFSVPSEGLDVCPTCIENILILP